MEMLAVLGTLTELPAPAVRTSGWQGRRVPASCSPRGRAPLFDHLPEQLEHVSHHVPAAAGSPSFALGNRTAPGVATG